MQGGGNRGKRACLADSEVRQDEGDDDVRRQMKADYSKRKQVPQSVLLSHAAHLPKVESEEESVSKLAGFTISSGEPVRWVRDFRAVLDNVYDLPADASVSSTTEEGRLFLDKGLWSVPITGVYLISALLTRRTDLVGEDDEGDHGLDDHPPRVVLHFLPETDRSGAASTEEEPLEWVFPVQQCLEREPGAGAGGLHHREWVSRAIADPRNSDTAHLAIDAQHARRVDQLRGLVEAEVGRRAKFGKQRFHFVRVSDMLDKNLQRNKEKLAAMQAEYAERQRQCETERAAVPSIAEFFGRLFRLHRSSVMRIGLTDEHSNAFRYTVTVTAALVGELTNYTVGANGTQMAFASHQLAKSFGCFKTARRFATGAQLLHHMRAKGYHLPPGTAPAPVCARGDYQCPLCSKWFGSELALKAHTDRKLHVKCEECGQKFHNENTVAQHKKDKHLRDQRLKQNNDPAPYLYKKQYAKAEKFYWPRPKFCCEMESCGRQFMSTEQLAHHHQSTRHYKCKEPTCTQMFRKNTDMYRHYKAKHDPIIYRNGLVERLQKKLALVKHRLEREKFGGLRWAAKKEKLEIKLARAHGISIEEYRSTLADQPTVTEGAKMEKSPTAHSVINIVPPREHWELMQRIRTLHVSDARCGPHISFVEPFVMPQHYPEAVTLLTEKLRNFDPFEVTLKEVRELRHEKSTTLYLAPDFEAERNIINIVQAILSIFPQCSDLLSRGTYTRRGFVASSTLFFLPHFTLRKIKEDKTLWAVRDHYESVFEANPIKFMLKEIYILNRIKGDPFQVCHIIPLGPPDKHTQPYFGPGSPGSFGTPEQDSPLGRTVLIGGIPQKLDEAVVIEAFRLLGLEPKDAEVVKNPDGARRSCAVVELSTVEDTKRALETFEEQVEANKEELTALGLQPNSLYLRHMPEMVFPGPPGDCCSLRHVKREDVDPPGDEDSPDA